MKESIITAILSVFSAILLVGAVVGIFLRDNTAPVISLEGKNTMTYTEGEDYEVLLEDVTAEDEEDGDVTESLRVSSMYMTGEDRAVVLYVAKDESNNIGKLKREVRYQAKGADAVEEMVTDQSETKNQTATTTQPTTTAAQPTEAVTGPRVVMLQNEATLKVGETFNIYRYIRHAVDANGNNISRSMHVEGNYNMNIAGVYPLQIYALDGNGVRSNVETLTLTVTP